MGLTAGDVTGIGSVADLIKTVVSDIWPNPEDKMKHLEAMAQLEQAGVFKVVDAQVQQNIAQMATNTAEAQTGNIFMGGWRPFIGWVGGFSLAYTFLLHPFLGDITIMVSGKATELPTLDMGQLMPLVLSMLGITASRTYERALGVAAGQTPTEMPSYQPSVADVHNGTTAIPKAGTSVSKTKGS